MEKLESIIPDPSDPHCAITKAVCIENTHNWCGGRILPQKFIEDLHKLCVKYNMKIHIDGSRIMNASVATNTSVKELCKYCDSINFCFSKVKERFFLAFSFFNFKIRKFLEEYFRFFFIFIKYPKLFRMEFFFDAEYQNI